MKNIIDELNENLNNKGLDPVNYFKGLLHNKPINYWDYINVDTLLSLQKPRTHFKDETIFIVYHQITELVLKLIKHELEQLCEDTMEMSMASDKIERMVRYTDLLIGSFSIMSNGMSYEDYNQFRLSLAPASGFQSAQFRFIEIYCTDIDNLIHEHGRLKMPENCSIKQKFDFVYWQEAGYNREKNIKSITLSDFENRYLDEFVRLAEKMKTRNLYQQYLSWEVKHGKENVAAIKTSLRNFDQKYNIEWPLVHLQTAQTYLNAKGEGKKSTGGSEWEKYLHPKFQRRIFFPGLWNEHELANWGNV